MFPSWNSHGVLPPFDSPLPTGEPRSPYVVSLTNFVLRFATTPERITILKGFLAFRHELHAAGIVGGFQWLDGSFLEESERIRNMPPHDIDVTTFFYLPAGETQDDLARKHCVLFDPRESKRRYCTDGYMICLDSDYVEFCVQLAHYWYGVWSHQRDTFRWKGFVQIDIAPHEDAAAFGILQNQEMKGNTT